jgi:hypothetical protein
MKIKLAKLLTEPTSFFWCRRYYLIDPWRVLSLIHLGDAANAFEPVRSTLQHQSLK